MAPLALLLRLNRSLAFAKMLHDVLDSYAATAVGLRRGCEVRAALGTGAARGQGVEPEAR